MHKYEVGKLLKPGIISHPESNHFDFHQSGATLLIILSKPTPQEIQSIRNGKVELGLFIRENVIFFLSKFGSMSWMDSPYSIHLSKPFEFEDLTPDIGYSLNVILTDASTGIIKAMRLIGMPNVFSHKLQEAIDKQKALPFESASYNQLINKIYKKYNTDAMVKQADAIGRVN
jgi:hypothetical protein